MLCPQERALFLQALRPPDPEDGEQYQLDFAVGTTFSLDLIALLAAPVAAAFADWQELDGKPSREALALLKAVRQYADRMCLFCQAGRIYVPKAYQPLLADLESSVVQVRAPLGGSFHPKVWVMRYVRRLDENDVRYRFLCLSRNLTFDRSWDTMLQLEGDFQSHRTLAFKRSRPLADFVRALPGLAMCPLAGAMHAQVARIGDELLRVDWELPEGFDDLELHPLGIEGYGKWPFAEQMDRLLVVSPFVDDGCLNDFAEQANNLQLVSRPESLAVLLPQSLGAAQKVWVLDDGVEAEPEEDAEQVSDDVDESPPEADDEPPLVGLHAKLYVADQGWNASLWTGSANATRAAFNRNVEFLVELKGKRSKCGVEAILGESEQQGPRRAESLRDLLQPYQSSDPIDATELAEAKFEREVDRLAVALAAANPVAQCELSEAGERCSLELLPGEATTITLAQGWNIRAWPISLSVAAAQEINLAATRWCRFEGLSVDAITSFFAFEVTDRDATLARRFVLNLRLQGEPANRRERMLRNLLENREGVLRYFLLLLLDEGARQFGLPDLNPSAEKKLGTPWRLFEASLFESLVRALDRDPERIDQVAQVVADLRQTAEGQALLPEDFDAIWLPLMSVRSRQREQLAARANLAIPEPTTVAPTPNL